MNKNLATKYLKALNNEAASLVSEGTIYDNRGYLDTGNYMYNAQLCGSIYGGLPSNRIMALAGDEGTGKTFALLGIIKKFLDNVFIDDVNVINQLKGDPANLLFEHTISSNIAKRICNVCEGFSNDIITCKIKEKSADFHISTVTNEHFSEVIKNISLNQIQEQKYSFNFQSFSFTMEGGDIKVSVYRTKGQKIVLWKFYQEIFQIPVTITGRSEIIVAK